MRAFLLIAVLAVVAVNSHPAKEEKNGRPVVQGYKQGDPCPAKYFYDDCNSCFCFDDGHTAGCTLILCNSELEHIVEKRSAEKNPDEIKERVN